MSRTGTAPLPAAPFLYSLLDLDLMRGRSPADICATLVGGGVTIVQLRAKSAADADLLRIATDMVAVTASERLLFIVNDRPDVARMAGADGVHVGQDDLSPSTARAVLGPEAVVGLSTHDLAQVEEASVQPVDYVAFGPVFPSTTKRDGRHPEVGVAGLRQARRSTRLPLVAIGGITAANVAEVLDTGVDGVAVASALLGAPSLSDALGELHSRMVTR